MSPKRYHSLTVRSVVEETADSRSIIFDLPETLAGAFAYRPGQFLTLRLPLERRRLLRCYSMSSTPGDPDLRITVKRVAGGLASNWLCEQVKPGDAIDVMTPAGVFTPRDFHGDFLLFGAGSGITPVYSILRSVLAHGSGRIRLLYANRDEASIIFRDALSELARAHPRRLQIIHWLDSAQGVPSILRLAELAHGFEEAQAWICGPQAFMDAVVKACSRLGMTRIHVETFRSLPDEADALACTSRVESAEILIDLDGTRHRIPCGGAETVLSAALRAGIEIPHACKAGLCASCMCQVQEGAVEQLRNEALDAKDLSKGWVLCCQAVPVTRRLHLKFPA